MGATKSSSPASFRPLTRYPVASLKEICAISSPLMLTALSGNLMLFCDRLILARYSVEAMNAAVSGGIIVAIFTFGATSISSIAEVFVGQHNGAAHYFKLAEPVWQMIWFSILTWVLFIPLALWLGDYAFSEAYKKLGIPYYQLLMMFGPFLPMMSALSAFYIGQGKVKLVTFAAISGNILNVILDLVLIYGVEGILPEMGTTGAAVGTVASQIIQVAILFLVFLNSQNRKTYNTLNFVFKAQVFWNCLRIGLPNAIAHMLEIGAWAFELWMLAALSPAYLTVVSIGQSIFILFAFLSDGLQKGVIAIASNLMGAQKLDLIPKMVRSSIKLQLLLALCLSVPLIFYPQSLISSFLCQGELVQALTSLNSHLTFSLLWVWLFILFDGLVWIFAGILTASGDTKFVMIMSATSAWLFCIVPIYFIVVKGGASPAATWGIVAVYGTLNAFCFFLRYHSQRWRSLKLV